MGHPEAPEQCKSYNQSIASFCEAIKLQIERVKTEFELSNRAQALKIAEKILRCEIANLIEESDQLGQQMVANLESVIRVYGHRIYRGAIAPITKSCLNCKYLHEWSHPGSLTEPPDGGWECGHPGEYQFLFQNWWDEFDESIAGNPCDNPEQEEKLRAYFIAGKCEGHEYFDWDEYKQQEFEMEKEQDRLASEAENLLDQRIVEAIAEESPKPDANGWYQAGQEVQFCPSQYDFHWNEDYTKFKVSRVRWSSEASYINYQSME